MNNRITPYDSPLIVISYIVIISLNRLGPVNPENAGRTQTLYDNADVVRKKQQTPIMETADNPQYGDTLRDSNVTSDPKSNETFYSYAIP